MDQYYNYGNLAKTLLAEGHRSSRSKLNLGYFYDDGERRFRWAHVTRTGASNAVLVGLGVGLAKGTATVTSGALLSASMFTSAADTGFGGGKGDFKVKVYSAVVLNATDGRFDGGYLNIISGVGAGYSYRITNCEVGAAGKATIITLRDAIRSTSGLSTTTQARVLPNKYYGLSTAHIDNLSIPVYGITTASGSTSGYQFIQTRGIGIGRTHEAVTVGHALMVGTSGLLSSRSALSGGVVHAWARSVSEADGFAAIDICIE